jgi:hypothetical protein
VLLESFFAMGLREQSDHKLERSLVVVLLELEHESISVLRKQRAMFFLFFFSAILMDDHSVESLDSSEP